MGVLVGGAFEEKRQEYVVYCPFRSPHTVGLSRDEKGLKI